MSRSFKTLFSFLSLILLWLDYQRQDNNDGNVGFFADAFVVTPLLLLSQSMYHHPWSSSNYVTTTRKRMSNNNDDETAAFVLKPDETAIIFIEYQNEFTSVGGKFYEAVRPCLEKTNMLQNSVDLLAAGRDTPGCTIIHCPIHFERGHHEISLTPYGILNGIKTNDAFVAGAWNSDFYAPMRPTQNELVVKGKSGLCGFMSTNLDFLLRQNNCRNVILCGFLANCCVESTMRTAYEKGYTVYTVPDCLAATSIAAMDSTVEHNFGMFSIVTSSTHIIQSLRQQQSPVTV